MYGSDVTGIAVTPASAQNDSHFLINGSLLYTASTTTSGEHLSEEDESTDDRSEILNWNIKQFKGTSENIKLSDLRMNSQDKMDQNLDPTTPLNGNLEKKHKPHKLSQLPATAICGNDLLSSCLYVTGLCTSYAGFFAPLCLLLVDLLLYLYRSIYSEVGSAIALNGASYTLLLNTTTKRTASLAACLTMISYIATAVVSASTAIQYIRLIPYCDNVPLFWGCVVILAIFAFLNLVGISESAIAALLIFSFHIFCLVALCFTCFGYAVWYDRFETLKYNWRTQFVNTNMNGREMLHHVAKQIYLGFGAGMLGVTGFETSANFIEQQKPGVFPKTLRNMWFLVTIFNPTISFLSLCVMPLSELTDPETNSNLLSQMGMKSVGRWFQILLSLDAAIVLAGSVLTSYVGITGLLRQMALDRCFPALFLRTNRLRGTNHWIIITFFVVCVSMSFLLGQSQLNALAGVYAIAFLSVMSLFAAGDLLLKYKRGKIKRGPHASKTVIVLAMLTTIVALTANVVISPEYLAYFFAYYVACAVLVLSMLWRVKIIKFIIYIIYSNFHKFNSCIWIIRKLITHAQSINSQSVIYFCKNDSLATLNKAILYIRENELTSWVRIVHVYARKESQQGTEKDIELDRMRRYCSILDEMYPKMRIDFLSIELETMSDTITTFGPEIIDLLEKHYSIRKNLMFISCPSEKFAYKVADLHGVRIITSD